MSKTPALDRGNAVNCHMTDTDNCCLNCKYSRTKFYYEKGNVVGTKFVCDELLLQIPENYTCDLFDYKKKVKE